VGHGGIDHALAVYGIELVILCQALVSSQPGKGAFHYPAAWQDFKAFHVVAAQDNLDREAVLLLGPREQVACILSICPDLLQARKVLGTVLQNLLGSLPVILVGGGDKDLQDPSARVYEEVAFAAFDFLVRVIADVIVCFAPPFSVVLTDWLSKTAAEGVGSCCSRTRSASRKAA
jgi:hypothetical protein